MYEKYIVFKIYHHIYDFRVHEFVHSSNATRTLTEEPLERDLAADVYQEANLVANEYLHIISLNRLMKVSVQYTTCWNGSASGRSSLVRRPGR